jgi:ribosomal protein S2
MKMYSHLYGLKGDPDLIILLGGGNSANSAIKESLNGNVPVLATRDTSALLSRKISYPIFVNDKDP